MGYDLSEAGTRVLLREACAATGLSPDGARLLRLGSNAVYRLTAPVVVRITRRDADLSSLGGRLLSPAGSKVGGIRQSERSMWTSQSLSTVTPSPSGKPSPTTAGIRRDRGSCRGYSPAPYAFRAGQLHLPELRPFENAGSRIADSEWLSPSDRDYMTAELTRLKANTPGLISRLPRGVIHGDANIGNVLRDLDSNPVVIDLDGFAVGPREWDLIQTALYYDHYGWHTREEYETFIRVYGYDIMQWPGYPVLAVS